MTDRLQGGSEYFRIFPTDRLEYFYAKQKLQGEYCIIAKLQVENMSKRRAEVARWIRIFRNISEYSNFYRQAASKVDELDLDRIFLIGTKTARLSRQTWKNDFLRTKFLSLLLLVF